MTEYKIATGIVKWYMTKMRFKAWTSYFDTIHFIDNEAMADKCLIAHEEEHIRQMKQDGKFMFTVVYLYEWFIFGYHNISYEIQAYKIQNDCYSKRL